MPAYFDPHEATVDAVQAWLDETDDCDDDCEACPDFGDCLDLDDSGD